MNSGIVNISGIELGKGKDLVLFAGPCVIESGESALKHALRIKAIAEDRGVPFVFKASYDKANRSSINSFRGPGLEKGLDILRNIKEELGLPVISDVHSVDQVSRAASVLDVIQVPAFLCRQTDLIVEAASTGKPVNVKKGQFMSPGDMKNVADKLISSGCRDIVFTERGTCFGYNMLINDFRGMLKMAELGYPIVYDATHSVQIPGGSGDHSGGESRFVLPLSRAAVAAGCDGLFLEVHSDPSSAKSDGPNMVSIDDLGDILGEIKVIERAVKKT